MAERALPGPPCAPALIARAGAALIPGAARLGLAAGGGGRVPDLVLSRADVAIDRDRLARYTRVCGFNLSDTLPPTYPGVLAFGLRLALMTDPGFPLRAVGLVHIANRITVHRPLHAREPLTLRVRATPLAPHRRGQTFELRTEAWASGELVWEEAATTLARGDTTDAPQAPRADRPLGGADLRTTAQWSLPSDLGRRYAAVSGDRNPIHLHPLTARPFGFPAAIAHGMWTKARCLAALAARLPDACTIDVAFRKPIRLPARVGFAQASREGAIAFAVHGSRPGVHHLDGLLSPV